MLCWDMLRDYCQTLATGGTVAVFITSPPPRKVGRNIPFTRKLRNVRYDAIAMRLSQPEVQDHQVICIRLYASSTSSSSSKCK
jgi:hypothetical protein